MPFGVYFLFCLNDDRVPFLSDWRVKAVLVFGIGCTTELAFGAPLLDGPLTLVISSCSVAEWG